MNPQIAMLVLTPGIALAKRACEFVSVTWARRARARTAGGAGQSDIRQVITVRQLQRIAVVCSIVLSFVLAGCSPSTTASAPTPRIPEVSVVTIHKSSVPITTELPGRTAPVVVAEIRSRVDGIVLKRDFKEGGVVKANERLFQIDPKPYRAALASAIATLARARAALVAATLLAERYKVLLAGVGGVSKQDYDDAVAAQGQAAADVLAGKAAVETARINLGYTDVVSPIAGRIGPAAVTEGAFVQAGAATLMATIQQIDPIYVNLNQSSLQGLQLRRDVASGTLTLNGPGQAKVTLILEDGTPYPHAGTLQFTDITVDPATGSVTVRALFPNPRAALLPGMFVRARIDEGTNVNAMFVPQVGVTHDPSGKATALVVGSDNKVSLRTIQATRTSGSNWVVESGLRDGDRVIVAGAQKLQPGTVVRAAEAARAVPAAAASN
ncbi:MAG: efflux transporter periplasmic adaptor subunit [Xanthomonadaceae bacterium]|nr:efflux transporter periplasmic adaptor subunit [Xanthomonadaceae bacterium]